MKFLHRRWLAEELRALVDELMGDAGIESVERP
jgi:hypothetical protein